MNWEAIFWLAAMVIFIIAEATTVTLVSIWFAVGALGAILIALLGGGLTLQVTVFLALAIVLLIFLRGAVRKHFAPRITRTNVDSVIGATGIVVATLIFMCAIRFVWVYLIFPLVPNLTFLYLIWPIGWVLSITTLLFVFFPTAKKLTKTVANPELPAAK